MADIGTYAAWTSAPSRRVFLVAMLGVLWCASAAAVSSGGMLYDSKNVCGGPKEAALGALNAIAQTTDGSLCEGNAGGRHGFDGFRLARCDLPRDPRLSSMDVFHVFAAALGASRVGFALCGALAGLDGGTWRKGATKERYTDIETEALVVDSAGRLWAASRLKVPFTRRGERFFRERPEQPPLLLAAKDATARIGESLTGVIWVAYVGGARRIAQKDIPERRTASSGRALAFDRDGSLPATSGTRSCAGRRTHPAVILRVSVIRVLNGWDVFAQRDGPAPRDDRRRASYSSLGAGPLQFHEIAAAKNRVWNDHAGTSDFAIAPTFDPSSCFTALCVAGAPLILWLLIRIRVGRVVAKMRGRLDARLAERERIARELYDTLLQSTQGLVLRFHAVANRIPREDPTRQMLESALDRADKVSAEGCERVLDLRVHIDTLSDLPQAFAAAGQSLAWHHQVTFCTVVEGTPRELLWAVKDEAYRIGWEGLLNAFQYSQPTAIEVRIVYSHADFRLRVRDDGRGFAGGAVGGQARPEDWRIIGMRERAERIRAELEARTRPGGGAEIELRIRAAAAYEEPRLF